MKCADCKEELPEGGYSRDGWHMVQPDEMKNTRRIYMRLMQEAHDRVRRPLADEETADLYLQAVHTAKTFQPIAVAKCSAQLARDAREIQAGRAGRARTNAVGADLKELEGR